MAYLPGVAGLVPGYSDYSSSPYPPSHVGQGYRMWHGFTSPRLRGEVE